MSVESRLQSGVEMCVRCQQFQVMTPPTLDVDGLANVELVVVPDAVDACHDPLYPGALTYSVVWIQVAGGLGF